MCQGNPTRVGNLAFGSLNSKFPLGGGGRFDLSSGFVVISLDEYKDTFIWGIVMLGGTLKETTTLQIQISNGRDTLHQAYPSGYSVLYASKQ